MWAFEQGSVWGFLGSICVCLVALSTPQWGGDFLNLNMHRIDEPLPEQRLQNKPFTVMNNHLRAALQLPRKRCNFPLLGLGVFQLLGVIIFPENYDGNVPRCQLERHFGRMEARDPLMGTCPDEGGSKGAALGMFLGKDSLCCCLTCMFLPWNWLQRIVAERSAGITVQYVTES